MQIALAEVAVAACVLGLLYSNLVPQSVSRRDRLRALARPPFDSITAFSILWVIVLFIATWPTTRPWSAGLTLGWGFLVGAVLALYAAYEATGSNEGPDWAARAVGLLSAAALGPSALLLIFHGYPTAALVGCALGAVLVAAIASSVARPLFAAAPEADRPPLSLYRGLEIYALATVSVALSARLGMDHFPRAAPASSAGGYWSFPGLALAAGALALVILSGLGGGRLRRWGVLAAGGLGAAVVLALAASFQARLLPSLAWQLPLAGALVFGFLLVILTYADQSAESASDADGFRPIAVAFGAILLALALVAVAFTRLHGYGEALALLPGLPLVAAAYLASRRDEEPVAESLALGALSLVALLALYRLFLETAGRGWELDFQRHYDSFAVVLGVGGCFGLLGFVSSSMDHARAARAQGKLGLGTALSRVTLLGVLITVVPLVLAAVWGVKAVGAFLAGLAIGCAAWMLIAAWVVGADRAKALAAAPYLYFIAAALVAIQFTPPLLALEVARSSKIVIVAVVTVIAVLWVVSETLGAAGATRPASPSGGGRHEA
jgi:hypothetical protein